MSRSWRTEVPMMFLLAAMIALAAYSWSRVPSRIAAHWNAAGQVDRVGGKVEGLLLLPAATVAIYILMLVLPRFDPGLANYRWFAGTYAALRLALVTFMAGIYSAVNLQLLGRPVQIHAAVAFLIDGLFLVVGERMAKIRPNWFVGIRTPWTLSSKLSWNKTHRLGGWLFIGAGVAVIVAAVVRPEKAGSVLLGSVIATVIWTFGYSYRVWGTIQKRSLQPGRFPLTARNRRREHARGDHLGGYEKPGRPRPVAACVHAAFKLLHRPCT